MLSVSRPAGNIPELRNVLHYLNSLPQLSSLDYETLEELSPPVEKPGEERMPVKR